MEQFYMLFKTSLITIPTAFLSVLRTAFIVLSVLSVSLNSHAESNWWDEMDVYVGAGVGQSSLTPYHLTSNEYDVDERSNAAWKLTAGFDVNDYVSLEGYYSDLGSTTLSSDTLNDGKVGYRMAGADALLYYWSEGEKRLPNSLALYVKAGLNQTNTYHSRNIEENNDVRKAFAGLGAEVYLENHFSVRFEFESYNADASLLSLNLVKRFGFNSKKTVKREFVAVVEELPVTAAGPKVAFLIPVVLDSDLDGMLDDEDQCLNTLQGVVIDEFGCDNLKGIVDGLVENLQFDENTHNLTQASQAELDKIVGILNVGTAIGLKVTVYAENAGRTGYVENLSENRAESVLSYLAERGIASERMSAVGDTKEKPVADADLATADAKNSLVEFTLTTH
jgi:outer membrane protein OmpA-like peptidoglycan-associated protein